MFVEEEVAAGRSYTQERSNPALFRITTGTYDVEIGSVEVSGKPIHRFSGVEVEPKGRVERSHDFASGTLKVGAAAGSELVDVTVKVVDEAANPVAQGRTYTSATSNPKTFELAPGRYRVTLGAVRLEGRPKEEIEVTVEAGQTVERMVAFAQ